MGLMAQLEKMRSFYNSGITRPWAFRIDQLKKLRQAIINHEQDIYDALYKDLKKSPEEAWVTENGMVLSEMRVAIKNLKQWMESEMVSTNLLNLPSGSRIIREPLGVVLIISPWNYPFQLTINPLIGAIAAGNCVVLKPSEFAPATDMVMKKIMSETFPEEYICYVQGEGHQVIPEMMNGFRFDHVFYTGSTPVGRIIYKMAADKLVPVTLELGGKSPCVVEEDANIKVAARRIAIAKFSNSGQMCVAPDYVLVHESKKQDLIQALKNTIGAFFTGDPSSSSEYGKMINEKQFDRVAAYLKQGNIVAGGGIDREKLFIEPTIIENVRMEDTVMKEEIFGPVLPVISFKKKEEALKIIEQNPDPLSFYIFTSGRKKENEWLEAVNFGGGCVNNCAWHITNHHLPFGGRGSSGMGSYHGRHSFDVFSHKKAVMKTPAWFDPDIKYPPLKGKLKIFKWVIR